MSGETVRKLYITLRRSFAGTKETQRKTLETLGFNYREQTVLQNNTESVRGAILKVRKAEAYSGANAHANASNILYPPLQSCHDGLHSLYR